MISRWVTINCDDCGDHGPLAADVPQARLLAEQDGFIRTERPTATREYETRSHEFVDLCPRCKPRSEP